MRIIEVIKVFFVSLSIEGRVWRTSSNLLSSDCKCRACI